MKKKRTAPFVTRLWRHQSTNQVILDLSFYGIDQTSFPDLGHKHCNGDEGCVSWPRRIKRCGVYCAMLLNRSGIPAQPRRYPIKWFELRPYEKGRKTLVLWRGGYDSLDVLKVILGLLGVTGAATGPVKHSQVELFANVLHSDLHRVLGSVRNLLSCGWGFHVLQETPPGTLHKGKRTQTFLEGQLIRTEICRVLPARKCPEVELVIYDVPGSLQFGYMVKIEVVVRAQEDKPFTTNEVKKLEKIVAGFLIVLTSVIGVQTHGLVKRQNGEAYPYKRLTGTRYGRRSQEAYWYAVELGESQGLGQREAVEEYLSAALSFLACCLVIPENKSRILAKYGTPMWGPGKNGKVIRTPITPEVNHVMRTIGHAYAA